jgi:hypothetical protein
MAVDFREINISPEEIHERQVIKEKQVPDGKKDLIDEKGNTVKDSLGKIIRIDRLRTIRCEVNEITQYKSSQIVGQVQFEDLKTSQLIDTFPLDSEYVFQYKYATYNGNRNALDNTYLRLIKLRAVPFPSTEQMVYDSGENLKNKLKQIITRQAFR